MNEPRYLVIGGAGLVGSHVLRGLRGREALATYYRSTLPRGVRLDSTDPAAVERQLDTTRPAIVILAAAERLHVDDQCRAIEFVLLKARIGRPATWAAATAERRGDCEGVLAAAGKPASLKTYVEDRAGHDGRYLFDHGKARSHASSARGRRSHSSRGFARRSRRPRS